MINPMDLTGKHILVTGGSAGIGRAVCILASKLGAKVSFIARSEDKLAETLSLMDGDENKYYTADLSELNKVESVLKTIVSEQGKVDGAVHCAGVAPLYPISLTKNDRVQNIMNINFAAFVEIIRVLGKKQNSNDGSSFVGISSVAAFRGGKGQGIYSASKGAIVSILKPMAKEYGNRKIRVNSVAFGEVDTDLYKLFMSTASDAEKEQLAKDQYLGVLGAEDAANAICFLLSDASRFITGSTIHADGGFLS